MKSKWSCWLATGLMASSMAAHATSILGEWTGMGVPVPPTGVTFIGDVFFQTQTPAGLGFDLTGTVDVVCQGSADPTCGTGGFVDFTGTLSSADVLMLTLSTGGLFDGTLSPAGKSISGVATSEDGSIANWNFSRVPEPATLSLLGLGLAAAGVARRKRNS